MAILHHRLRRRETGGLLFIMSCLLAVLFLSLSSYYISKILSEPQTAMTLRYGMGFAMTVVLYMGVLRLLLAISGFPKWTIIGATAAVVAIQGARVLMSILGPAELAARFRLPALFLISCYLFFLGLVLYRAARGSEDGTVAFILKGLGSLTLLFAPLSFLIYLGLDLLPGAGTLGVSLDFLFILVWSVIVLAGFLRYLSRPSAFIEEGRVSPGFVSAFGITPREAEVVALIGRGLSNQEIADALHVSFTTARTHIYNLFRKTGAGSRVDLLRLASGYRE